ncbi:type II secretion system F family protein [Ornithinicoccus halotolerans]|uniref:type II secretion system F family protein n=1 Tax=Ornithinicoccus halotolerans TaxID=1748220 RepID=UPI001E3B76D6|nr:type II secretion system F family protein [Ornithinicoccus halotolerans]
MTTSLSLLVLAAAGCLALAVPLLVWSFTTRTGAVRQQTLQNLRRDLTTKDGAADERGAGLLGLAQRLTPASSVKRLDRLLARAGRPAAWPVERVMVTKLVLTSATLGFVLLLSLGELSGRMLLFGVGLVVFAWFVPEILLYNAAQKRQQSIQEQLPDTLDQLTIAVEAGLGFEAAMAQVARNGRGPLGEEIVRTLQDIQVGQSRRAAYTELARRAQVDDLRRFIRSIIQADEHGISIARVLATQAKEMRLRRRQRAEEKAMQIPVKVIFPLILVILPALFIVIMGPAAINIMEGFGGKM